MNPFTPEQNKLIQAMFDRVQHAQNLQGDEIKRLTARIAELEIQITERN
jgi:hypothetical protein